MHTRLIPGVALVLLVACGVPPSDQAVTATGDDVPYGLLSADVESTTTTPGHSTGPATIWLVAQDGIVPVAREVEAPTTLAGVMDALAAGPTDAEATFGARSAIPENVVGEAEVVDGIATVDLRAEIASASPREQLLALAQLVHTATELDSVDLVNFTLDDQPVDVPRGDGSISDGPVRRRDYATLVAS